MAVIPACSRGPRGKHIAPVIVGGNVWRTLLVCSIHIGRDVKTVPVNQLLVGGVIRDVDGDRFPFGKSQHRSGNLTVVDQRLDGLSGTQVQRQRCNTKLNIRL
jgi:hypothetical protein